MKCPRPEALLMLLMLASPAPAQQAEEIVLRADKARIDQRQGTGVYEGNAEMTQGNRHLSAERIFVQLEAGQISRVEAIGQPVRLTEGETLSAHANRLVYEVGDGRIHLFEDAFIAHEGRTFEGARLRYDLETRQVEASGGDKDRVRLVIPAEDKSTDKANGQPGQADTGADIP